MAGFSFSTLEMIFNAPARLPRGISHVFTFYINYGFIIGVMTNYYFYWEIPLAKTVDWRVEVCFLVFIIPFRLPLLWRRALDNQRLAILGKKVPLEKVATY